MQTRFRHASAAAIIAAATTQCFALGEFQALGDLPGDTFESQVLGMSANGQVVFGYSRSAAGLQAFKWDNDYAMVPLGFLSGASGQSAAYASNSTGTKIVGFSTSNLGPQGFVFDGTMQGLGDLPDGPFNSQATGMSLDGSVIVGRGSTPDGFQAFKKTSSGFTALGFLPGGNTSIATGCSGDGSIIVGTSNSTGRSTEGFWWTQSSGMHGIGSIFFGPLSYANAISRDGTTVVGRSGTTAVQYAFRWRAGSGIENLGGVQGSEAFGCSQDGDWVVGYTFTPTAIDAMVWDRNGIRRRLIDLIQASGISGGNGWNFTDARAIIVNGSTATVIGNGINRDGKREGYRTVFSLLPGDASNDCEVSLADYAMVVEAFGSQVGDSNYQVACDFDNSDTVDLVDYSILVSNWGKTC